MKSLLSALLLSVGLAAPAAVAQVVGSPWGFATGVTGGGNAKPVYPTTNAELVALLGSAQPQVIVLTKTFQFVGTEGTTTAEDGCAPWGQAAGCQLAINANGWCGNRPRVRVTYDTAGTKPIYVKSNKTLVGQGSAGVISGKGLYLSGVSNVIIQNIQITDLNPKFVWGGDALTFFGTDLVWIDHVRTSKIGRQHYVTGFGGNKRHTWSNNYLDGKSDFSASCDGRHYWGILVSGDGDEITFQNNYIQYTSGRSPALSGNSIFHAVNSVWSDNNGHALEGGSNARGLFEGCYFDKIKEVAGTNLQNKLFSASPSNRAQCQAALGRTCLPNGYRSSGTFPHSDASLLADFKGRRIAPAGSADEAFLNVPKNAGNGKL
ncbi:pectin lyase C [Colletotrichum tabaci]|uniref:pectin lyase n=1 Tax=Colletotrichum tabaci TaxID=1209068 RepID=A0AAV9TJX6_9PEZI